MFSSTNLQVNFSDHSLQDWQLCYIKYVACLDMIVEM